MQKPYGLLFIVSSFAAFSAFGISSYQVRLKFTFPDGTSAKETLLVNGTDWTTAEIGKRMVKVRVEPHQKEAVKTTITITGQGDEKPRTNQFITRLNEDKFASIQSKDNTGRTYEVKVAVKENQLNDSER